MPQVTPFVLARRIGALLAIVLALALTHAPARAAAPAAGAAPAESLARAGADSAHAAAPAPDYVAQIRANFTPENRAYARTRVALSFIDPLFGILVSLLLLATGLSARFRDFAHRLSPSRYLRVLVYFTIYSLVGAIIGFPLTWYEGFRLEHQYGLSHQAFGGWFGEQMIGLGVSLLALGVVPLVALAYTAIEKSPKRWWLWLACGTLPVIIATILISPYVDMLTNKFQPLRDQQLKTEILDLAKKAGVPARNVYEVDKSKQTTKYNAYVSGFGVSQRVVIWDTTLKGMKPDEILFVTGHEMGHYVLHHIWKLIGMVTVVSFLLFWLTWALMRPLVERFGPRWGFTTQHDLAAMPLLAAVLTVVSFVAQPISNGYSRTVEHQADTFGLEVTHLNDAAARAFIKLGTGNRSDPEPPAWLVWLQYSHPPLIERVRFAVDYHPWEQGQPDKYFKPKGAPAATPTP